MNSLEKRNGALMNRKRMVGILIGLVLIGPAICACTGCRQSPSKQSDGPEPTVTFKPQEMADALHAVIAADREVYALHVLQRLQAEEKVVQVAENWKKEKALPLPSQMLRLASESIQQKGAEFHYVLRSLWPINQKDAPETVTEKTGLQFVADHPGSNYYAGESLGGRRYFTAVYADVAISTACANCHNQHQNSPKRDFKVGDVMGGIVIRIPLEF
jgi:cytochrome c553